MQKYSHTRLSDAVLVSATVATVSDRRSSDALLLSQLAEIDRRRLHLALGFTSMHAFCVGKLGLADASAYKRIRAARVGRRFPSVFDKVADGRLHVAALVLLRPHLDRTRPRSASPSDRSRNGWRFASRGLPNSDLRSRRSLRSQT